MPAHRARPETSRSRVAGRLYAWSIILACAGLALTLVRRDWVAAVPFAVLVAQGALQGFASVLHVVAAGAALAGAVVIRDWLAVPVIVMFLVSLALARWAMRQMKNPDFSAADLAQAVRELIPAFSPHLAAGPVGLVDSLSLLNAAIAADPYRWREIKVTEPRKLSAEGGKLADTGWTIAAAEALQIARCLPGSADGVTIHDLAVAASFVPDSNAQRALGPPADRDAAIMTVAGLSLANTTRALSRATVMPGGSLIMRRAELVVNKRPFATTLTVGDWREVPNPRFTATRQEAASSPSAKRAPVQAPAVRPPAGPAPAPTPPRPPAASQAPPAGRPAPRRRHSFRSDTLAPALRAWRPSARVLWWILRPLSTLVAVIACLGLRGPGVSLAPATAAAILVILIRPIRQLWSGLLLGVLCAFVSPAAAAAVGARTLITLAALFANGPGWGAGLARLVQWRLDLLGVPDIDGVWRKIEESFGQPQELMLIEGLAELLASTWCRADIRELARQTWKGIRGYVFGAWPFGRLPSAEMLLLRMTVAESVIGRSLQSAAAVAAILVAVFFPGLGGLHVAGHDVARPVAVLIGVVACWPRAAPRRPGRPLVEPGTVLVVIWSGMLAVIAYFCLGLPGLWIMLSSAAIGLAFGFASTKAMRPRLAPRITVPRLPVGLRWRRGHDIWQAARAALMAGTGDTAERLWHGLATGTRVNPQIRAQSQAMLASLALDRGAWQEAVQRAGESLRLVPSGRRTRYLTQTVAARVMLAAGDPRRSLELLREAEHDGFGRRLRRDPVARLVLAQALASTGDTTAANEVLSWLRGGFRGVGFGPMIEAEALVATMAPPTTAAADRLKAMLEWVEDPNLAGSIEDVERLERAAARAWLALGDLEIRLGTPGQAEASLRRALTTLPVSTELANHAIAQVLLGCAIAARRDGDEPVQHLGSGLSRLEAARGQLRDAFLRTQLVLRLDAVYSQALDALITLQGRSPGVGEMAAVLLESLRRDALASVLRQGEALRLDPGTRAIQRDINELEMLAERDEAQVQALSALRTQLSAQMTGLYAEAYSPVAVTFPDLRARARDAHVLTFKVTHAERECLRGYSVWIPPRGEPFLAPVEVTSPRLLEALGLLGREIQETSLATAQMPADAEYLRWLELGICLFPGPLLDELARHTRERPARIILVPDGILTAFPWAGLRIADGRHLVEVASLHVIPAMSLIQDQPNAATRPAVPVSGRTQQVMLHCDAEADPDAIALLSTVGDIRPTQDRAEIEAVLAEGQAAGAYFSTHGDEQGFDQQLRLLGGAQISAASALMLPWPDWLIFASCIVGTMQVSAGTEPTGLVTSCLLGGADSVVAGVVEVNAHVADRVCVSVAARIIGGQHPADALRLAQLAFIESRDTASVDRWAGYICVSRIPPPRPPASVSAPRSSPLIRSPDAGRPARWR